MKRKAMAAAVLALTLVPLTGSAAQAGNPVDSNVVERVECLFRVYVTEGGEQGLDCLT